MVSIKERLPEHKRIPQDKLKALEKAIKALSMAGLSVETIGFRNPVELTRVKQGLQELHSTNGPVEMVEGIYLKLSPHAQRLA